MGDRKLPRAEDIFSGRSGVGGGVSSNIMFKNKKAPAPPGPLPKIGNYTPKSLMAPTPGMAAQENTDLKDIREDTAVHRSHAEETRVQRSYAEEHKPKQFIMGDKDTPIKFDQFDSDPVPVAPPRRKRRAPSVPDGDIEGAQVSSNPLFGRSISNDTGTTEEDFEEQGGVIDFDGVPAVGVEYDQRSNDLSNVSTSGTIEPDYDYEITDIGIGIDEDPITTGNRNTSSDVRQNGDSELPYIPPPDYDDEERIFNFADEGTHVYKEYTGEDYGKYLDDDEDYRLQQRQRGNQRPNGQFRMGQRRVNNPRIQGKMYKKKKKGDTGKMNTLRDFTYNDTKIGWGDRTVKSTSAKGRQIKREKERNKIDSKAFNRQGPSYEDFLLGKKDLDSPNSSDSGVDTGERMPDGESNRAASDIFYHSQPKQMRNGMDSYGHKDSLWKRLTWKFKKSVNISKMGAR